MGSPKRKRAEPIRPVARPTPSKREAAEDRTDVDAYDRAMAEWEADGRRTIPFEQIKRRLGLK
jgi:hypothetical protein